MHAEALREWKSVKLPFAGYSAVAEVRIEKEEVRSPSEF
jgi:hypothetical protein